MKDDQIETMMSELDYNQNHEIDYSEFIAATIDPELLNDEQTLRGLFNQFDLDNDGTIDRDELVKTFSKFGKNITVEEIDIILQEHDKDRNGNIQFEEFQ